MTYVIIVRLFFSRAFYAVGNETKDGSDPEQEGETTKEIFAEFDPFWDLFGRRESVRAISLVAAAGFG